METRQHAGSHVHCRWDIKWFAPLENSLDVSREAKHWESTRQWHWTSYQNIQVGWVYNMGGKVSLKKSHAVGHYLRSRAGKGKTSVVTRNQGLQGPGSAERKADTVIKGQGERREYYGMLLTSVGLLEQTDKPIWWQSHINEIHTNTHIYTESYRDRVLKTGKLNKTSDLFIYSCCFVVMLLHSVLWDNCDWIQTCNESTWFPVLSMHLQVKFAIVLTYKDYF